MALRKLIESVQKKYHADGFLPLMLSSIKFSYNQGVRKRLPRIIVDYNGVEVRAGHSLDKIIPWQTTSKPNHEHGLIQAVREDISIGEIVVVIGGGWGTSSVAAAHQVGEKGTVHIFEGSSFYIDKIGETLKLNDVPAHIDLHHAVVERGSNVRGDPGSANRISSSELPNCDTLVLDCEGAEKDIIQNLSIKPEKIIVETHGLFDSPSEKIKQELESIGYRITGKSIAEVDRAQFCMANDIYVLTAINNRL